ncbi:unnamed protein product, partial [Staurois parvus]
MRTRSSSGVFHAKVPDSPPPFLVPPWRFYPSSFRIVRLRQRRGRWRSNTGGRKSSPITFDYLSKSGYEWDENAKMAVQKEQQELLMKMFALSCKLEREFRGMELAEFMAHNVMNLAIKYASRSKRLILAQRLS